MMSRADEVQGVDVSPILFWLSMLLKKIACLCPPVLIPSQGRQVTHCSKLADLGPGLVLRPQGDRGRGCLKGSSSK